MKAQGCVPLVFFFKLENILSRGKKIYCTWGLKFPDILLSNFNCL